MSMVSGSSNPVETETAAIRSEVTTADSLVRIEFNGDELHAVQRDGTYWVSLRRCCENLGVALPRQIEKLQSKPWASVTEMVTVDFAGKSREMTMIDRKTLLGWMFSIDERKVAESIRPKLIAYQQQVVEVLDRYFSTGTVPQPSEAAPLDSDLLLYLHSAREAAEAAAATLRYCTSLHRDSQSRRLSDAERQQLWDDWINGMNNESLIRKYNVSLHQIGSIIARPRPQLDANSTSGTALPPSFAQTTYADLVGKKPKTRHPNQRGNKALFDAKQKLEIYRRYLDGAKVSELAAEFNCTIHTLYKVINKLRAVLV